MKPEAKVLGVITARAGSKGIPGKNIKLLGGKPLIAYSVLVGKQCVTLTDLIVSTDGEEIAAVAKSLGAEVPFLRPAEFASDTATHIGVMEHAILFMENARGYRYDYAVILQPTSPFRVPEDVDLTVTKLVASGADSAVTLVEVTNDQHPIKAKKLEGDRVLPFCIPEIEGTRRQDLPKAYRRSGAVYAMRRDLLVHDKRLYGDNIVGHVVPRERSIDIDEPIEWVIAEHMLQTLSGKGYEL